MTVAETYAVLLMVLKMANKSCKNPNCECTDCEGCTCIGKCTNETCSCNKQYKTINELNSSNDI